MTTSIKLTLSRIVLGPETTDADWNAWTRYVSETIQEGTGLETEIRVFGAGIGDANPENTLGDHHGRDARAIYGWLSASTFGRRDGAAEVADVLNEQGREVVVATLKPGHLAWDESARSAHAHKPEVPDANAAAYYRAYEHFARLAAERIRGSE